MLLYIGSIQPFWNSSCVGWKHIEYGGEVEHLGRCELNTFVAVN